jgi:ABC-2 type transport system permease protein
MSAGRLVDTGAPVAAGAGWPAIVAPAGLRHDLRAVRIVWLRELMRFRRDKPRLLTALLQPLLYLFVLGAGMASMTVGGGDTLRVFLFPGVIVMAVLFTSFSSAGSLVWDREFGFMREMLVAPVRRGAILLGKALGGASAGTLQGAVVLGVGAVAGVPCPPALLLMLLPLIFVIAFAVTSLGLLLAVRIRAMPSFISLVQLLLMPLYFLSGALFPLGGLPPWLEMATRLNPLTYAVDPLRRALLQAAGPEQLALAPGVVWFGRPLPAALEVGIVAAFGVVALLLAARRFGRD